MAVKKTIIIDAQTNSAEKSIDNLTKSTDNLNESTDELSGSLDKVTGGAISGFKGVGQSVKKAITGFKNLRVAIIATGIGALVIGIISLQKAFTASEEGQNRFAKLMGQIGVVTGNVVDILANLGESIFAAGKALVKLAKGDLKGASAAWGELKENVSEVVDGVKNFGEETKNEIKLAGQIANARAKADKAERKLILDRAEANRKIAELREIAADKENVSVQERLDALREAGKVNDEISQKEIETARLRFEAKKLENSLSKSTKEDLDEQARLQAELINLETARLNTQKRLTAEITGAIREEQAERNAALKEQADAEKLASDEKVKRDKDAAAKAKKLSDAAKQDAINQGKLDKQLAIQKQQDITNALGNIASIVGQNSKFGKAIAVVQAIRDTYAGANKALAQGGLFGFIGAAAVVAGGLANVKAITSAKEPTAPSFAKGGGRGVGSVSVPTATPPQPPSFNIVGASGTNQLAEAIGGQAQQPVKAFVVSNDISTAQELDRNIVEGASIG